LSQPARARCRISVVDARNLPFFYEEPVVTNRGGGRLNRPMEAREALRKRRSLEKEDLSFERLDQQEPDRFPGVAMQWIAMDIDHAVALCSGDDQVTSVNSRRIPLHVFG